MKKLITLLCLIALLFGSASRAMDNKSERLGAKLIEAAAKGNRCVVRMLIAQGAPINVKDIYGGWTPLFFAASCGHEAVCRLLIEKDADLDEKNYSGDTPLIEAVANGHEAVKKLLIGAHLRRSKAPIITFLGIVRKRKKNLPCQIQYDVAKMIARMVFDPWAVQKERLNIKAQIDRGIAIKKARDEDRWEDSWGLP